MGPVLHKNPSSCVCGGLFVQDLCLRAHFVFNGKRVQLCLLFRGPPSINFRDLVNAAPRCSSAAVTECSVLVRYRAGRDLGRLVLFVPTAIFNPHWLESNAVSTPPAVHLPSKIPQLYVYKRGAETEDPRVLWRYFPLRLG